MRYTKRELNELDTIEQSWDGAELKIHEDDTKVWLNPRENRQYDGDYTIEKLDSRGSWQATNHYFEF